MTAQDDSTPARKVVKQFLSAIVDGRSGDAAALIAAEGVAHGVGRDWLEDRPPISRIEVGDERIDSAAQSDHPTYLEVRSVPVSFYLDDFSMDQGFEGGDTGWGYLVGETQDHQWLILDNGMG